MTSTVAQAAASEDARLDKIDGSLLADMKRVGADKRVEALVVLKDRPQLSKQRGRAREVVAALAATARTSQAPALKAVKAEGGELVASFWLNNMVLVQAKPKTLERLTAMGSVERIIPNFEVTLPRTEKATAAATTAAATTWGISKIGADFVQNTLGVTGDGIRVAVLDTGVDIAHPDLAGKMVTTDPSDESHPGGWMEFSEDGVPVRSAPHDTSYHGTHVAGTIVGGAASGTQIGVAPGVELMAAVAIPDGSGTYAQILGSMQWAAAPYDADGNPAGEPADVVNMSLGSIGHDQEFIEPTLNLYQAGIFPAFAIGNDCPPGASSTPANVYEATAVGATDSSDNVGDFSCGEVVDRSDWAAAPAEWPESYVVPDISAPGVDVYSAMPDGSYGSLNGTSMATPHVAGTVALMLQRRPALSVDEALQALIDTSVFDDRYGAQRPNSRFGWGRIDARAAVEYIDLNGGVRGTVTDAQTGEAIAGAAIRPVGAKAAWTTDETGAYELKLPAGSYDLEVSAFGYRTVTVTGVAVPETGFVDRDLALTLAPRGRITGRVVYGPTGSTVPGATVRVRDVPVDLSATTDTSGSFTITGVPVGAYRAVASASGLASSPEGAVTVASAGTPGRLDLTIGGPTPTERISVNSDGTQVSALAYSPAVSADGRFVTFYSDATTHVAGDGNGTYDAFLSDRWNGAVERISVSTEGVEGNGVSGDSSPSRDGRIVAFYSDASNLVPDDTNDEADIFVRDRAAGTTVRVSRASDGTQSNGRSSVPSLSTDGRFVAYDSSASNLVAGDTNGQNDIFVFDRETGTTQRVSVASGGGQSDGYSAGSSISADGRYVAFISYASNLVADDTNGTVDVFVHDRLTGATQRVSVTAKGEQGNSRSLNPSISGDGRYVAFGTDAPLVPEDTNGGTDIFVRDRVSGVTERVSVASGGGESARWSMSTEPSISADGRYVAFQSTAANLVEGDTNGQVDVFLHDRQTDRTEMVSAPLPGVASGPGMTGQVALSGDGRYAAFASGATNLVEGDTNGGMDIFSRDMRPDEPAARFVLADLKINPASVRPGKPVTVTALVKNLGNLAGEYQGVLRIDGRVVATSPVVLEPGEMARVAFTVPAPAVGMSEVAVGRLKGSLTVTR
ncbi:S8 family serine peptidase [Micromonospora sp. CA-259024]|uniref:S8 family serine peptidase n=1 Tax=Micromonospora sp. CA-259024 TaxID=3239965 RepID=UPI003D9177FE